MAYFSNGTEGELYREQWCDRCVHADDCAVWDTHMLHNYEECNNKESILHELIPMDGIWPGKCKMFLPIVKESVNGREISSSRRT